MVPVCGVRWGSGLLCSLWLCSCSSTICVKDVLSLGGGLDAVIESPLLRHVGVARLSLSLSFLAARLAASQFPDQGSNPGHGSKSLES